MPGRPNAGKTTVSFARVPIREGIQRAGSLLAPSKASGVIMVQMTGGDGDKDSKDNDENSDEVLPSGTCNNARKPLLGKPGPSNALTLAEAFSAGRS
jgi:hypothetical protein